MTINTDDFFNREPGAKSLLNQREGSNTPGGYDNLQVYRYPNNVGNDEYPHYMMFYVFTRSDELEGNVAKKQGQVQTLNTSSTFSADTTDLSSAIRIGVTIGSFEVGKKTGRSIAGMLLSATGAETAIRSAGVVQALSVDINSEDALEAIRSIGGTVGSVGVTLAANTSIGDLNVRGRTMFNKAIALYMPSAPSVSYQAGWNQGDIGGGLGVVGTALEGLVNSISSVGKIGDDISKAEGWREKAKAFAGIGDKFKNVMSSFAGAFRGVGQASVRAGLREANNTFIGQFGNVENAFSSTTRQALNPYRVQLFNSMGFRNFSFTYKFLPKNATEYQDVKNIIQTFKEYMHPAKLSTDLFVGYPAEFVIAYYYKENENTELFRTSRCALTNLRVSYGDQDFVTFKSLPGGPVELNLTITFTELELLDRERIRQGY